MVKKHSFVYLNMYMLLPYQPVNNILPLHLRIRVTGKMKPLIYKMGVSFKAQPQQMWSKLSDEIDVIDDHTANCEPSWRGDAKTSTNQYEILYLF